MSLQSLVATSIYVTCRACLQNNVRASSASVLLSRRYSTEVKVVQVPGVGSRTPDIRTGPGLAHFISNTTSFIQEQEYESQQHAYLQPSQYTSPKQTVYFDVYGCQMNVSDAEIVWSILQSAGYEKISRLEDADVVLVVTCSIREGAETKVWNKLKYLGDLKKKRARRGRRETPMQIGVLGCMAERLKSELMDKEKCVDVVAGPDSYRDLPRLLSVGISGNTAMNVQLSLEETYADVIPVRLNSNNVSAFVSIMRGCDNMCSYCIVPRTRGRERSRPLDSILEEVKQLSKQGIKEITLLGQNVNSYLDKSTSSVDSSVYSNVTETILADGFKTIYKRKKGGRRFADLLRHVAAVDPEVRIRFTSPHPKDFPDEVLHMMLGYPNICSHIHLPAQCGSSTVLDSMRRGYTREAYLDLVAHIRRILPNVAITSDFIAGFCGETDQQFDETLSLISAVQYNRAFTFAYSMREKTHAHRKLVDDVADDVKLQRLQKMKLLCEASALQLNTQLIGSTQLLLIEGAGRRNNSQLVGRNDGNTRVVIDETELPDPLTRGRRAVLPGDYVTAQVTSATHMSLKARGLQHTTLQDFSQGHAHI